MLSMLLTVALGGSIRVQGGVTMWKQTGITRLLDRANSPGVVAVTTDKAIVYDADGRVDRQLPIPEAGVPISFDEKSLTCWPKIPPRFNAKDMPITLSFAGSGSSVFSLSAGLCIITPGAVFSCARFNGWCAAGIRPDNAEVCLMTRPMSAPILRTFTFQGESWVQSRATITPEVEDVGQVIAYPGYNDIRYVGQHSIVFLGKIWPEMSPSARSKLQRFLGNAKEPIQLDEPSGSSSYLSDGFLFILNLDSLVTRPVAAVRLMGNTEGHGVAFGTLSVSSDRKFVFIRAATGVARVRLSEEEPDASTGPGGVHPKKLRTLGSAPEKARR